MAKKNQNKQNKIERPIYQINADGQPLGRLSTKIAILLRGKNKADFQPHLDLGGIVEVINCEKIKFTGKKIEQKEYRWHTNYPGGLKRQKVSEVFVKNPGLVLRRAVWGMLPKNKIRKEMIKRLKVK